MIFCTGADGHVSVQSHLCLFALPEAANRQRVEKLLRHFSAFAVTIFTGWHSTHFFFYSWLTCVRTVVFEGSVGICLSATAINIRIWAVCSPAVQNCISTEKTLLFAPQFYSNMHDGPRKHREQHRCWNGCLRLLFLSPQGVYINIKLVEFLSGMN